MPKKARSIRRITVAKHDRVPEDWPGSPEDFAEGWWIRDPNNIGWEYAGPYDTRKEADEERRGLERFWKYDA